MSEAPSFFAELKRRNVLRVAAFYAAAGWLLVQITTQVFPFFNVSSEIVRGVVVVGDPASATPVKAAASARITVKSLTRRLS